MVYKKYIKRNGRLYGPYIYHSKRVDGKVVSEYRGTRDFSEYKKFVWIFLGIILLLGLVYGFSTFNKGISGMAVFDIDAKYFEGESLDGLLAFSLQEGELLPASTKVVFENFGQVYRFDLSEIVSEDLVKGDYYVKGKSFQEEGWGYGVEGVKNIYPEVSFTLDVYSTQTGPISQEVFGDALEENLSEIQVEEETEPNENEEVAVEESEEEVAVESKQEQNVSGIIVTNETNEIINKTFNESQENFTEPAIPNVSLSTEYGDKEIVKNVDQENITENIFKENNQEELVVNESQENLTQLESAQITGGVIGTIFKGVSNFFLSLTPTGNTGKSIGEESVEVKKVQGNVLGDKPFEYSLEQGQSVRILPGSVRIDSEKVSDNNVNLEIEGNKVFVTTNYARIERGFGPEYVGTNTKQVYINLTNLGLVLEPGELKTKLIYEDEEIVSMKAYLSEGSVVFGDKIIEEVPETEIFIEGVLTDLEREILLNEFGNAPVSATKMEVFNDRLIVRFELRDNWIEYSYDYAGQITPELEVEIESDRITWLKDIARKLSNEQEVLA